MKNSNQIDNEAKKLRALFLGVRNKAEWVRQNNFPGGASMLSQNLSGHRPITQEAAAICARSFGVSLGEISPRIAKELANLNRTSSGEIQPPMQISTESYNISQYNDVRGAMGSGLLLRDQPGQITGWRVTAEWIEKNVPSNTGKQNLCIVTGFGDSMRGMFNSGDPLIVDAGIKTVEFDGV